MATRIFAGDAVAVAQVDTVQITAFDATTTYILTINGKTVSVSGVTDVAATTAALEVALNASTIPEFAEITALDDDTDTITLTADTAGKPFTVASSVSGGAGTIGAVASVTASDGPNAWSANNFTTAGVRGTLPANADTVILRDSNVDILYSLDQTAVNLLDLQVMASYTGTIGLPKTNVGGYDEYRQRSLTYTPDTAGTVTIGEGDGNGSTKLRMTLLGANLGTLTVIKTDSSSDDFKAAEIDLGSAVGSIIATGGTLGITSAVGGTITAIRVDEGGDVLVSDTVATLTGVTVQGGTLEAGVATVCTALTLRNGAAVTWTGGDITTLDALGGTLAFVNTAALTVTTTTIGTGGSTDSTNATATITNVNSSWHQPGSPVDPAAVQQFTNAVDTNNALISEFTSLDLGRGRTLLPG